jgi:hypothetical protein
MGICCDSAAKLKYNQPKASKLNDWIRMTEVALANDFDPEALKLSQQNTLFLHRGWTSSSGSEPPTIHTLCSRASAPNRKG